MAQERIMRKNDAPMALARLQQDAGTAQKCHPPVKGQRWHLPKKQKERQKISIQLKKRHPTALAR